MPRPAVSGPGRPGRKRQRLGLTEPGVVCCPGLLGQSLCAPPSLLQRPRDMLARPRAQVGSSGTSWREGARTPPCNPATPCSPCLVLPRPRSVHSSLPALALPAHSRTQGQAAAGRRIRAHARAPLQPACARLSAAESPKLDLAGGRGARAAFCPERGGRSEDRPPRESGGALVGLDVPLRTAAPSRVSSKSVG